MTDLLADGFPPCRWVVLGFSPLFIPACGVCTWEGDECYTQREVEHEAKAHERRSNALRGGRGE